jgi:hypothetical protein
VAAEVGADERMRRGGGTEAVSDLPTKTGQTFSVWGSTERMVTFNPSGRLLVALFDLTQAGECIDLFSLSESAGLNLYRTLSELDSLGKRGLVDAGRLRLTIDGLAVATALDRRSRVERTAASEATGEVPRAGVLQLLPRSTRQQPEGSQEQLFARDLVA